MGNLREHAIRELDAMGYNDGDDMNQCMKGNVLDLIDMFAGQGHSGFSASHCTHLFYTLSRFQPIGPLTGEDSEWVDVSDGLFQNIRCSHVFKKDGEAYDIDGKVFREPDGYTYTNFDSRTPVIFPYIPSTVYVNVEKSDG